LGSATKNTNGILREEQPNTTLPQRATGYCIYIYSFLSAISLEGGGMNLHRKILRFHQNYNNKKLQITLHLP